MTSRSSVPWDRQRLAGNSLTEHVGAARTLTPSPSPGARERGDDGAPEDGNLADPHGKRHEHPAREAPLPRTGRGVGMRVHQVGCAWFRSRTTCERYCTPGVSDLLVLAWTFAGAPATEREPEGEPGADGRMRVGGEGSAMSGGHAAGQVKPQAHAG